jgi:hypothetical protein
MRIYTRSVLTDTTGSGDVGKAGIQCGGIPTAAAFLEDFLELFLSLSSSDGFHPHLSVCVFVTCGFSPT